LAARKGIVHHDRLLWPSRGWTHRLSTRSQTHGGSGPPGRRRASLCGCWTAATAAPLGGHCSPHGDSTPTPPPAIPIEVERITGCRPTCLLSGAVLRADHQTQRGNVLGHVGLLDGRPLKSPTSKVNSDCSLVGRDGTQLALQQICQMAVMSGNDDLARRLYWLFTIEGVVVVGVSVAG